eukprot:m.253679 g.253679  ORF g.253679 m.253679 type:complete len:167 (+) comp17273_c0_seq1:141-641(+)
MTNTKGYRRGTRYMFSRDFRKHGVPSLTTYLTTFKVGDFVDIKGNGTIQAGMPHKVYHGKTGRVFNVTKRAVGVIVNKRLKNRWLTKKINVRIEHVHHSKCQQEFKRRVAENDKLRKEAREKKIKLPSLKRQPAGPRGAHFVRPQRINGEWEKPEELRPLKFEFLS